MRRSLILITVVSLAGCTKADMKEPVPPATAVKEIPAKEMEDLQKHQNAEFAIPEKEITIARLKSQYEAADANSEAGKALKVLLDKETSELEELKKKANSTKPNSPEIITSDLSAPAVKE